MKKYKKVQKSVQVVTEAICDRCGKEIPISHGNMEGTTILMCFGYNSDKDLQEWDIDICDKCADWLREQFPTLSVREMF